MSFSVLFIPFLYATFCTIIIFIYMEWFYKRCSVCVSLLVDNRKKTGQLYNGNTVLEAAYLLNASKSSDYQQYTTAYADLQLSVLRLLAEGRGASDTMISERLELTRQEILDVIAFEADLANVSVRVYHVYESETAYIKLCVCIYK